MKENLENLATADWKYVTDISKCAINNFEQEAEMLQWAGVGFGEETTVYINKALKRLAKASGAHQLRFFGKVYGM